MAKVVQVQVSSLTERKTISLLSSSTINEILAEAGIEVRDGTTLSVNGMAVNETRVHDKLDDFDIDLNAKVYVTAVVNSKNA